MDSTINFGLNFVFQFLWTFFYLSNACYELWIFITFSIRRYFFHLVSFMYRKINMFWFLPTRHLWSSFHIMYTHKIKSCSNFIHTTENSGTNLQILYLIQLYVHCMVPFFVKSSKNSNYFRRLLKSTFMGSLINTIIYSKKNIILFNLVWWTVTKKSCYSRNIVISLQLNIVIAFPKKLS